MGFSVMEMGDRETRVMEGCIERGRERECVGGLGLGGEVGIGSELQWGR